LVGTTADFRRPDPWRPLPLNHLPGENRGTVGRIGEVRLAMQDQWLAMPTRIGSSAEPDCSGRNRCFFWQFLHVQLDGPAGIPGPSQRNHSAIRIDTARSRFCQHCLHRHGRDLRRAQRFVHGEVRGQSDSGRRPVRVLALHFHHPARDWVHHVIDLPHADPARERRFK